MKWPSSPQTSARDLPALALRRMHLIHSMRKPNSDMVAADEVAASVALLTSHDAHTIPGTDILIAHGARLVP